MRVHAGGCACGAIRFEAEGSPIRVGLCHCLICRKHQGAAFNPFVVFKAEFVFIAGSLRTWRSSDHASRLFCGTCGSPICQQEDNGEEIELHLGSFDDVSLFTPLYENWIGRRETWLPQWGLPTFQTEPDNSKASA